ncbi:FAD binding domain-containing protein [Actinomycetospora sp. C-140]
MDLLTVEALERPADDAALRARVAAMPDASPAGALLAGGTWLFSVPQPHLRTLVDLTTLSWPAVTTTPERVTVAATATIAQLVEQVPHPLVQGCAEALVGSHKVWNVATVGGNIALALPAGPMTTLAVTLDATAVVWPAAGGETRLPVADLVVGAQQTLLGPGDVLRAVELPSSALRARTALRKASLAPLGRSAVLLGGRVDDGVDGGGAVTLAVTAARARPAVLRFPAFPGVAELDAAVLGLEADGPWYDDPHGTPAWRRAMTRRLAREIVEELA